MKRSDVPPFVPWTGPTTGKSVETVSPAAQIDPSVPSATAVADEAIELFREAVRQPPPIWNHDVFEDCLANGLLDAGRLDEAIAEYERILTVNPNYPLARFHLAQAWERKNDTARAAEEYRRFLDAWNRADADIPELVAARSRLGRSRS